MDNHLGISAYHLTSRVRIAKGGAVDKSEAFAPTYPPFVMRNSDLRSSFFARQKWPRRSLTKTRTCFSKETKPPTDQNNISFLMKNNVSIGEGEYVDEIFS